jgi:AraC-like DNA-binding protein
MRRRDALELTMLSEHAIFTDVQPSVVSQFICRNVGVHRMRPVAAGGSSGSTSSLHHQAEDGISFSLLSYGIQVEVSGPPQVNKYQMQLIRKGACKLSHGKRDFDLQAGDAVVINPYYPTRTVYQENCQKLIVAIDKALLETRLHSRLGFVTARRLEFGGLIATNTCNGAFLLSLLHSYCDTLDRNGPDSDLLAVNAIMKNALMDAVILCAENSHSALLAQNSGADPALRMLTEYITANILGDITVAELAALIHVGERRLFKIFQTHLQTTPLHYIKSIKLQHVKRAIEEAPITGRTVTEIALDHGFTHLGRFSMDYRRVHGELPSETLMKARRGRAVPR